MSTAATQFQLVKGAEPIAGYKLQERIGAGGYGEVWKVAAPGELHKAIKFVYGRMDDVRAERELKSLHRVRDVRHPFLLSLERIEVVSGQLLIVTELADGNLKERFDERSGSGHAGISRKELLGYLRDAADALDYMRESFSLQHLDIKPENLLLVGGHVKIADFGLVKELQDVTASLVSGLTPVYASPELFDFRATPHSDQYSLAIVYQEMLTGLLPFPGRTPAQLAAQHLHSRPMVGPLPPEDRAAITRALSKDPEKRFPDCRSLIDTLIDAGKAARTQHDSDGDQAATAPDTTDVEDRSDSDHAAVPQARERLSAPDGGDTISVHPQAIEPEHDSPVATKAARRYDSTASSTEPGSEIVYLSPLEVAASEVGLRPTVFIGVGGVGGQALARVHKRLFERFDGLARVPIFRFLALDTDAKALEQLTQGDDETLLSMRQTQAMPLRRPLEYRADSPKFLKWLSRRWLYNIPRSLQTEGIRPLGRLALVDHMDDVYARIHETIAAATDSQSIKKAVKSTGQDIRDESPRIFVIASTSGGTGSGTVLDVARTVRKALGELKLSSDGLCAVLTHATKRNASTNDLAIANAYACLSEIYHFDRRGEGHEGDSSCGLPPIEADRTVFDDTYFLHFGEDLGDDEIQKGINDVADYLYLDATTAAGAFLDKCRCLTRGTSAAMASGPQLRTFGLFQMRCDVAGAAYAEENGVCESVVRNWLGEAEEPQVVDESQDSTLLDFLTLEEEPKKTGPIELDQLVRLAESRVNALGLDVGPLVDRLNALAEEELGNDLAAFVDEINAKLAKRQEKQSRGSATAVLPTEFVQAVDSALGHRSDGKQPRVARNKTLENTLAGHVKTLSEEHLVSIRDWIMGIVDDPDARLKAAVYAAQWFEEHFQSRRAEIAKLTKSVQVQVGSLETQLLQGNTEEPAKQRGWFGRRRDKTEGESIHVAYMQARVRETVLSKIAELLERDRSQIAGITNTLVQVRRTLNRIAKQFGGTLIEMPLVNVTEGNDKDLENSVSSMRAMLQAVLPQLVSLVDRKFQLEFLRNHGGLAALADDQSNLATILPDALRHAAWSELRRVVMHIDAGKLFLDANPDQEEATQNIRSHLEQSSPYLLRCGAATRLLVVLPRGNNASKMQPLIDHAVAETPSIVFDDDRDLIFCYEAEQISLADVAHKLVEYRPDCVGVANRIHTRIDVDWAPIPSPE